MGRRAAFAASILVAFVTSTYAATARLSLPGHVELDSGSSVPALPVDPIEPSDQKYVNFRPLIGILSQACHNCPGK